jgi:hypothetical protein
MEWPATIQGGEVQARLIYDEVPAERAMRIASEVAQLPLGRDYIIERSQGNLLIRAIGAGYFSVAPV